MKIAIRILVSPFILGILTVSYTRGLIKHFIQFIRYGGEFVKYSKNTTRKVSELLEYLEDTD